MAEKRLCPRAMIIGVGNAYRSDDAVGLSVARRIRQTGLARGVTVIEADGEGTGLMDLWEDVELAILIDAVSSGADHGTIHRFDANEKPLPADIFRLSTHAFGVAAAVELARELGRLPTRLIVYGIEGRNFSAGISLTKDVASAASHAVRLILAELI
jgi:hydrogenase maturation protease